MSEKDFPQFMNFLSTHSKWPVQNSQISKMETKQLWTMTIKQEPIEIVHDRSLEKIQGKESQNDEENIIGNIQESQFSVGLSINNDMRFMDLMNRDLIFYFIQQLQAQTYRQLLENENNTQFPFLLSAKTFLAHLEINIKPRNHQILDSLAIEMDNPVDIIEFTFTYNNEKANLSDFEYVSKIISSFPTLKNLTLKLFLGKVKREDSDFSPLFQSFSQLKSLKQLTLSIGHSLNYSRLNSFFQAIGQLPQLSYLYLTIYNCDLSQINQSDNVVDLNKLSKLSTLSLYFSYNKMCNEGANSLIKMLSKLTSIKALSLKMNYCNLNDQSAAYLGQAISQLKQLQKLKLFLAINKITSSGMQQILESINSNPSNLISDLCLELTENSYQNEGVIQIASSLQGLPRSITKLKIFLPTMDIEVSGAEALSEALLSLVNLIDLKVIFESDDMVDNDTNDDEIYQDSVEKQAYLGFFKRIRKLTNLRGFSLRNNYMPSKNRIKRIIMKQLSGLVTIK